MSSYTVGILFGERPDAMTETLVRVDAMEAKSGRSMCLRIPLNVVNMAQAQIAA